jgi:nickel/cobalt exporter
MRTALAIAGLFLVMQCASAHPVPKSNHDRTIVVRLQPGPQPDQLVVRVDYRLEVDPATVILEDMEPFRKDVDITRFKTKLDFFKEYTRIYAPVLADRLMAKHNGKPVEFTCVERTQTLKDQNGEPLDHLRCDFVFRAVLSCRPDKENAFAFREGNFQEQEGLINLSLSNETSLNLVGKIEPDAAVKSRAAADRMPGDDAKLRLVEARFTLAEPPAPVPAAAPPPTSPPQPGGRSQHDSGLLMLLLDWQGGFVLLLLACAVFGSFHALTPGHGKTLVAAYLVGQRGTVGHAVLLGLVTTITHTGAVLVIAVILMLIPRIDREALQVGLGLIMGLMIVALGLMLFLQRLAGRADHIHVGGGHHHHGQHHHHEPPSDKVVGTWGLILLGISGGLIPCWDAVVLLVFAVGANQLHLAFPMVLAFSAGLAGVLVLIGILVVKFRNYADSRWGEGRLVRTLPVLSALLVTAMGFWLCYEAVQGQ